MPTAAQGHRPLQDQVLALLQSPPEGHAMPPGISAQRNARRDEEEEKNLHEEHLRHEDAPQVLAAHAVLHRGVVAYLLEVVAAEGQAGQAFSVAGAGLRDLAAAEDLAGRVARRLEALVHVPHKHGDEHEHEALGEGAQQVGAAEAAHRPRVAARRAVEPDGRERKPGHDVCRHGAEVARAKVVLDHAQHDGGDLNGRHHPGGDDDPLHVHLRLVVHELLPHPDGTAGAAIAADLHLSLKQRRGELPTQHLGGGRAPKLPEGRLSGRGP
mmetsp:Transcript_49460/g.130714  ORF Transcript_49460/g.130714 Transcript_49460/m.130714 type:complete len:269 (+) Transcript_49460:144-950(+)